MIEIDKYDSRLLLIIKGWEMVEFPRIRNNKNEIIEDMREYLDRYLIEHYHFDAIKERNTFSILSTVAEKVLTVRDLLRYIGDKVYGIFEKSTVIEAIIIALMLVQCNDGEVRLINIRPETEFISCVDESVFKS